MRLLILVILVSLVCACSSTDDPAVDAAPDLNQVDLSETDAAPEVDTVAEAAVVDAVPEATVPDVDADVPVVDSGDEGDGPLPIEDVGADPD